MHGKQNAGQNKKCKASYRLCNGRQIVVAEIVHLIDCVIQRADPADDRADAVQLMFFQTEQVPKNVRVKQESVQAVEKSKHHTGFCTKKQIPGKNQKAKRQTVAEHQQADLEHAAAG